MDEVPEGRIRVSSTLVIAEAELEWHFSASGGPGGQHANTSNTRAEVRFDVATSASLTDRQRARLLDRLGPEVRAAAQDERSQARNRSLAQQRLVTRLADALREERPRRPTKPSRAAKQRRLEHKRRQGQRKQERRRPRSDDA